MRKILAAGALPVELGGDHSINIPCIDAFEEDCAKNGPIHVVQFGTHPDFVDVRQGVRFGHSNLMRRASEKPWVTGMTQLGIRNISSTSREGYEAAREVSDDFAVTAMADGLRDVWGGLDVVVHCAGIVHEARCWIRPPAILTG